ncbi:hypothetical protein F0U59_07580 [Archangium gephyra]|nr:hypothetical protein F0U59_07580 [Archangium gephyra]
MRSSPVAAQLRQLLLPVVQLHDYSGYAVSAPDGTALASDLDAAVGLKLLLQLDPALLDGALRGGRHLSHSLEGQFVDAHAPVQPRPGGAAITWRAPVV